MADARQSETIRELACRLLDFSLVTRGVIDRRTLTGAGFAPHRSRMPGPRASRLPLRQDTRIPPLA